YKLPFDRHDWTVDRCGKQVTYVIDFYGGAPQAGSPVSFFVDVRPSLTMDGLIDRCKMLWRTANIDGTHPELNVCDGALDGMLRESKATRMLWSYLIPAKGCWYDEVNATATTLRGKSSASDTF
ncbi:hypothetical protein HK405_005348, partial [Cladochytrium tenue]